MTPNNIVIQFAPSLITAYTRFIRSYIPCKSHEGLCSPICPFVVEGDIFICLESGRVHISGPLYCQYQVEHEGYLYCSITGRRMTPLQDLSFSNRTMVQQQSQQQPQKQKHYSSSLPNHHELNEIAYRTIQSLLFSQEHGETR